MRVHRCGCRRVDGRVTKPCPKHDGRGRPDWHDFGSLSDEDLERMIQQQRRSVDAKASALTLARIHLEELQREKGRRI